MVSAQATPLALVDNETPSYPLVAPFQHCVGAEWNCSLPAELGNELPDSNTIRKRSRLRLYEDGRPLGPGHTPRAMIRANGAGAYRHWQNSFYFSTSDGTDPNTNGRSYSLVVGPSQPALIAFGSCHVDFMLQAMEERHPVSQIYVGTLTHYCAEVIQLIRFARREIDIPSHLIPFVVTKTELPMLQDPADLERADGVLLEVCNSNLITAEGYYLQRNLVKQKVLLPIRELGEPLAALAHDWYYNGIEKYNQETRRRTAAEILALLPPEEKWEMSRYILQNAEGHTQDQASLRDDIETIGKMLNCHVCVLGHVLRYMPDGRPMYWPPTFMAQLTRICRELDVPVLDPASIMKEVGPAFALADDGHHYTQAFIDLMADRMNVIWRALPNTRVAERSRGEPVG